MFHQEHIPFSLNEIQWSKFSGVPETKINPLVRDKVSAWVTET